MYHYIYEIVYQDFRKYIGVRSCNCHPELDVDYVGSSAYTPDDEILFKTIIHIFDSREEANAAERWHHDFDDVAANNNFYNRAKQTSTGFCRFGVTLSEEHKQKISKSLLGKNSPFYKKTHTEEARAKMRGRTFSEEHKKKLSKARLSTTHTEETKAKISKATSGENNPRYDHSIHHFYNVETEQSVFGKYFYLRNNSKKLFNLGKGSIQALKEHKRQQIKNWTYNNENLLWNFWEVRLNNTETCR